MESGHVQDTESIDTWGELVRRHRLELSLSLRAFCTKFGYDPGNHSRLERGRIVPPTGEQLAKLAANLELSPGTPQYEKFMDRANAAAKRIPEEVTDEVVLSRMPALLRTVQDRKLTAEQIDKIIELVRTS